MFSQEHHLWLVAPYQSDRQSYWSALPKTEAVFEVNCHSRLRGPYTGVGSLLRQIVPVMYQQQSEFVRAHTVEILSLAPELDSLLTLSTATLTALAIPSERTRFYSRYRTIRLAHGIIDLLKGCLNLGVFAHLTLYFDNVQAADSLDQELLGLLLRRADPAQLTVVVGTSEAELSPELQVALQKYARREIVQPPDKTEAVAQQSAWHIPASWQEWISRCGQGWSGEVAPLYGIAPQLATIVPQGDTFVEGMDWLVSQVSEETRQAWSEAYFTSDCTSDRAVEILAYQKMPDEARRRRHDERARELEQREEFSLRLGAIPYHWEHGTSPGDLGAAALQVALDYCIDMGFYEATVDFGKRGRAVIDWPTQVEYYWTFTTKSTTSLAALSRPLEAEELYNEARSLSTHPSIHMQAAYATAMLYTRHHKEDRRDHMSAKAWINQAIAIARWHPDPKERAFNTVFNQNGLALIENHLKNPQEALRLVTEGLERLERELEPGEHMLHRSVLRYNRAQVYAGTGQLELALIDYNAVIREDPYYSEYYFDRGNLYRKLGRDEDALADYAAAIRYSPPYPEAYYNRAGVLSVLGYEDEALADYTYVLELDPTYLDALVNRASIYLEREEYDLSRRDVEQGLQIDPENAQLLCTLGLLEMAANRNTQAEQAFSQAIERDPALLAAWSNRAVLAFEQGNVAAAIADFTQALNLEVSATVLYNRGIAYQAQESWSAAIDDFTQVLTLDQTDEQEIRERLAICSQHLALNAH